jgi:hydrogenase expression/formation protein HypD
MDVQMVYSPLDALKLARQEPERPVMFFAIGFETTAPSTALTLRQAKAEGLDNFTVFCNHITIMPALRALLDDPVMALDGFIGPGHVSTVIGCAPYAEIPERYGKPVIVAGFEPLDLLQSILLLVRQLNAGEARVENQYGRAVTWDGNRAAQAAMAEVFTPRATFEWRGLGGIPHSGLGLSDAYAAHDAEQRFEVPGVVVEEHPLACCGDVLKGQMKPHACPLFGTECTPEHPVGALMVSSEGACAAQYQYARYAGSLDERA